MKKITLTLVTLLFALISFAQTSDADKSCVIRSGNTYYVNDMSYSKKGFKIFLSEKDQQAYAKFNNGYTLSVAGWSCFGAGLALDLAGSITYLACGLNPQGTAGQQVSAATGAGLTCTVFAIIGASATVASIPLLAVGYTRMHDAADIYNANCKKPAVTLSLKADYNGLGVAMNF